MSFCKILNQDKVLFGSFHVCGHTSEFYPQTQRKKEEERNKQTNKQTNKERKKYPVQRIKLDHSKVLLSSFHLNGHTLGFQTHTQSKNYLVQLNKQHHKKVLLSSLYLNGRS